MNVEKGLICGLIVILLCLSLSGCTDSGGISVNKLDYEPEEYINITSEQMEEYPTMKECITIINSDDDKTIHAMSCNKNERDKIEILFGCDPTDNVGIDGYRYFKYQDEYYSIIFVSA